jgi:gas vesicle protein
MCKEDVSRTLFALMAGATVGAGVGVGLLFAPQAGSQFRSSLREYTRKVKSQVDQASNESTQSSDTHEAGAEEGVGKPGAESSGRSALKDHTIGDTGQDN